MSPQITWRNGGPLMLPNSFIGGSAACCCENPPPSQCLNCSENLLCSYSVEITQPTYAAGKSFAYECPSQETGSRGGVLRKYYGSSFPVEQWPFLDTASFPFYLNANRGEAFVGGVNLPYSDFNGQWVMSLLGASLFQTARKFEQSADVSIGVALLCAPDTNAPFYVALVLWVGVQRVDPLGYAGFTTTSSCKITKSAIFPLASSCYRAPRRQCRPLNPGDGDYILSTPIEVSLNGSSTSLGAYTDTQVDLRDPKNRGMLATAERLLEKAPTLTVRIASRSSCKPVECELTTIDGLIVTFGGFEFTLGTPSIHSVAEDPYVDTYEYYGGEGTAATPHQFVFTRYFSDGPFTSAVDIQIFEMWLGSDTSVQPPVSRWYVIRLRDCVTVNESYEITGSLSDRWTGHFGCYEASCGSGEVVLNQGIPDSEPFMARDLGYPLVTGVSCEEGFKSFGIRQNCGG